MASSWGQNGGVALEPASLGRGDAGWPRKKMGWEGEGDGGERMQRQRQLWVEVMWEIRDCWVGVYWTWEGTALHIYVCLIPCVPVHVIWGTGNVFRHDR
jgi:hypothetical protein